MAELDFIHTDEPQIHPGRRKEILARYPQVRELTGPSRWSFPAVLLMVAAQLGIAWFVRDQPWWVVLLVAYAVGAVLAHGLYVMIHEASHNNVLKGTTRNKVAAITADLPQVFPGAIIFRKFHLIHHRQMGELDNDADIAPAAEARIVGNSWWRKALWLLFFSASQAARPLKMRHVKAWDRWAVTNFLIVMGVNAAVFFLMGPLALLYLAVSLFFGLGLHPMGGRWIQEHYVTEPGQETYSYYGAANRLAFNIGHHVEHHDFMNVNWRNLPKLRKLAPEYYDTLASYRSWTWVVLNFIFNPKMSPFSRITHPSTSRKREQLRAEPA
mgnify:CR=1 FL=1